MKWKVLDHTADLAVKFYGETKTELLNNSALALSELVFEQDSSEINLQENKKKIIAEGESFEVQFFEFLRELLFQINSENLYCYKVTVTSRDKNKLTIICYTSKMKEEDQQNEIKAVTYHNYEVSKRGKRYIAKVIFDI